jgi:DNA-binding NarL/FixJ family response regulator
MNSTNRHISILVADDHSLLRYGIKDLLSKSYPNAFIFEADCLKKAVALLKSAKKIDVIILDIDMPGSSLDGIKTFIKDSKPAKILIYTAFDHHNMARRYIGMGAKGYLHKKRPIEEVQAAVETIFSGDIYIDGDTQKKLLVEMMDPKPQKSNFYELTDREMETCIEVAKGKKLTEIAEEKNIHVSTVSTLKKRSFEKLQISTTSELIVMLKDQFLI